MYNKHIIIMKKLYIVFRKTMFTLSYKNKIVFELFIVNDIIIMQECLDYDKTINKLKYTYMSRYCY